MLENTDIHGSDAAMVTAMPIEEMPRVSQIDAGTSMPTAALELLLLKPRKHLLITERTPDFWKEKLTKFLKAYKDGIPDTMIQSTSPDPYYKCRKGWFTTVCLTLDGIKKTTERGVFHLCPQLLVNMRDFVKMCTSDDFHSRHTVEEDISKANQLLMEVIAALHAAEAISKMRADCGQQALTAVGETER